MYVCMYVCMYTYMYIYIYSVYNRNDRIKDPTRGCGPTGDTASPATVGAGLWGGGPCLFGFFGCLIRSFYTPKPKNLYLTLNPES